MNCSYCVYDGIIICYYTIYIILLKVKNIGIKGGVLSHSKRYNRNNNGGLG